MGWIDVVCGGKGCGQSVLELTRSHRGPPSLPPRPNIVMSALVGVFVCAVIVAHACLFSHPWYHQQAMEVRNPARPTLLLTLISEIVVEGIISEFLVSDRFIVMVARVSVYAYEQSRVRDRRFFVRLEYGLWVYRDRLRGARARPLLRLQ